MRIIAVMSPKGGIGKTTTAVSLSYILGVEHGKNVLVLEGDPQGDTSKTFGCYEPDGTGMSELLERHVIIGGDYHTTDLIMSTGYQNVDIIPGNGYLMKTDMNLLLKENGDQINVLKRALEEVQGNYDVCICDCGRLFDMVVINILMASELIIAPAKIGGYEIDALDNLYEQLADLAEENQELKMKVLMTMKQNNKTSMEVEEWLRSESGHEVFSSTVRRSIVAERSTTARVPLPLFSKTCGATNDYRKVVNELLENLG